MPNVWISVKIACLVSRLRTRIFNLSQTETFRSINVIMKLKKVKQPYKPVPGESLQIPGSLVR